jgi:hypothetical protein
MKKPRIEDGFQLSVERMAGPPRSLAVRESLEGQPSLTFALAMNPRAAHFGAEEVDLRKVTFTPELLACVPAEYARRYRVLPVFSSLGKLRLALADPTDLDAIDSLNHLLHCVPELCVAEASQLDEFIERLYGREGIG